MENNYNLEFRKEAVKLSTEIVAIATAERLEINLCSFD